LWTVCPGWLQTLILLISTFWIARIIGVNHQCLAIYLFAILWFELRAYTLSHSTSPFLCWVFSRLGLENYLPRLTMNLDLPDLCLLSS
jgi:hypothetical protein